jgi:thioredoxin-dependent peroxiredoxin
MAATKSKATNKKAFKKATSKVGSSKAKTTVKATTTAKAVAPKAKTSATAKPATVATKDSPVAAKPTAKTGAKTGAKTAGKKVAKAAPSAPSAKTAPPVDGASDARALTPGDTVPAFEALDQNGSVVTSASLAGAPYVIYFYPKDDTPGCTTQACGFRDEMSVFAERGVKVLGVSPDSSASHARFAQKYGLEFTLLADTEKKLVTLFGVWKLKQNYGREYWGVERSTFVVDRAGKIAKQWRGVKVAGHVPAVLEAVTQL